MTELEKIKYSKEIINPIGYQKEILKTLLEKAEKSFNEQLLLS